MNSPLSSNLIHYLPIGLIIWQTDSIDDRQTFQIIEMNSIARHLFDIPIDQPLEAISDPFPAFLKLEPLDVYADVLRSKTTHHLGEIRYRSQPGCETILTVHLFPFSNRQVGAMIEDVTDRRHAEEELQRSKQKLLFHMQQTPMAAIEWDLNATVVDWNPAAEQIFGYQKAEILGKSLNLLLPEALKPEGVRIWDALLRGKGSNQDTNDNITKGGRRITCEWYHTPLVDKDGSIIGVASLAQDITDRLHTETAIASSEMRYRRLFEAAQDGIAILNAHTGKILNVNSALSHLLGYSETELVGQRFWDLGFSKDRNANFLAFQTVQREGSFRYENLPVRTKNGDQIEVEFVSNVYVVDNQQVIQCNIRDIGQRKQLEEELQAQKSRLAGILDIAKDAVISVNAAQEIQLFNKGAEFIFGYTASEIIGQPLDILLPEGVREIHRHHVRQFGESTVGAREMGTFMDAVHGTNRSEIFARRHDGSLFPAEASISKLQLRNETIFTVILRDITERKHAEQELQAFNARLEQSNRELQDFAFVASHDLQEPLRKIQAFGDRLRQKYYNALGNEGQDYVQRMQNAAKRMQVLINDLLAFSRITTKAQPFVKTNLAAIAQDVLSDLEIHIQNVGGRIEVTNLPMLDADPSQMRQLFQNLLSNALKFHQPGVAPLIQISASPTQARDRTVQISISDNGIGFDEKYLDRIFTVFQRLHGRNEYEGTGIGLAICRKIVEHHNGTITAKSSPGQGATFIITLPLRQLIKQN